MPNTPNPLAFPGDPQGSGRDETKPALAAQPTPQNIDGMDPRPSPQPPLSRAIRFAISAGPLTAGRLANREAEAKRQGVHLFLVCTEAELLHLQFIQRAMSVGSTWEDAIVAIKATSVG